MWPDTDVRADWLQTVSLLVLQASAGLHVGEQGHERKVPEVRNQAGVASVIENLAGVTPDTLRLKTVGRVLALFRYDQSLAIGFRSTISTRGRTSMTTPWIEWVALLGAAALAYYISTDLFVFACVGGFAQVM